MNVLLTVQTGMISGEEILQVLFNPKPQVKGYRANCWSTPHKTGFYDLSHMTWSPKARLRVGKKTLQ